MGRWVGLLAPWGAGGPIAALVTIALLSVVAGALDIWEDGLWDGQPRALTATVLQEPDRDVRAFVQTHRSAASVRVARYAKPLGTGLVAAVIVGALLMRARLARRPALRELAVNLLVASLLSAALGEGLKMTVGRSRPASGEGVAAFHGPTLASAAHSFPSGHASQAFALATVLSEAAPSAPVALTVQGLAVVVALSRVHDDRHFYSDVVAGALLGSGTAWFVVRARRRRAK